MQKRMKTSILFRSINNREVLGQIDIKTRLNDIVGQTRSDRVLDIAYVINYN